MSKEEIQKIWDTTLLRGWKREWSMAGLKAHVYKKIKGIDENDKRELNWVEVDNFIEDCNLKRCEAYSLGKQPVRMFVEDRSPNLSGCLWSGKYSDDELLEAIDRFKWKTLSAKQRQKLADHRAYQKKKEENKTNRLRSVKARQLNTIREWNVIK